MIVGTLNIREGCSTVKKRRIHQIITKGEADIFLMQETKLRICSVATARSVWRQDKVDFSASNSEGMSSGLITLWNARIMEVLFSFRGPGYLGIKVRWMNRIYYVCNVYSACTLTLKRVLWNKLLELQSSFCDGGERMGSSIGGGLAGWGEFSCFINDNGLIDVPCKWKKYSWFSGDSKHKSRIDQFLVFNNIINRWGIVGQLIGLRDISDHCPVWLVVVKEDWARSLSNSIMSGFNIRIS
ncbi:uncharacterized protein LOC131614460 [Vicia villosa]|uniref:uncharacterized protein LOC131614460 n=1 Tax=Vicia villosa TaxID=3911 RepID=UPI00273C77F5|nr:uncharacterized protein LOC131614460 [Vicia villosa]